MAFSAIQVKPSQDDARVGPILARYSPHRAVSYLILPASGTSLQALGYATHDWEELGMRAIKTINDTIYSCTELHANLAYLTRVRGNLKRS
jgi:hypothetical protein